MSRGFNPQKKFKTLGLGVLTTPFGAKTREESFHPGVDIANQIGTKIPSPVDGIVTKTDGGHSQGENNFGNTLEIKDAEGNTHQFHHLQNINVAPGQQVQKGQPAATMGNSGSVYSPSGQGDGTHLDYRIVTEYGKYKNPMLYLNNFQ
jgi:murein DD-endopeptidase MepM/ murein hydrolase activator NlpD